MNLWARSSFARALRDHDRRQNADCAFLRVGDGERQSLVHRDAGAVRIPGCDDDLAALEQRKQLIGLGVEHRGALCERLDRLDAGIDILQRPALDLVQRKKKLQRRKCR